MATAKPTFMQTVLELDQVVIRSVQMVVFSKVEHFKAES